MDRRDTNVDGVVAVSAVFTARAFPCRPLSFLKFFYTQPRIACERWCICTGVV